MFLNYRRLGIYAHDFSPDPTGLGVLSSIRITSREAGFSLKFIGTYWRADNALEGSLGRQLSLSPNFLHLASQQHLPLHPKDYLQICIDKISNSYCAQPHHLANWGSQRRLGPNTRIKPWKPTGKDYKRGPANPAGVTPPPHLAWANPPRSNRFPTSPEMGRRGQAGLTIYLSKGRPTSTRPQQRLGPIPGKTMEARGKGLQAWARESSWRHPTSSLGPGRIHPEAIDFPLLQRWDAGDKLD